MKHLNQLKDKIIFQELESSFENYRNTLKDTYHHYFYPYKEYYIYENKIIKFINNNYQTKEIEFWDGEKIIRLSHKVAFSLISASLSENK